MIHRIEIALKDDIKDPKGDSLISQIKDELGIIISSIRTVNVFTLDFDPGDLDTLAKNLLIDKILNKYTIDKPIAKDYDFIVEKCFKPGVTDNIANTAKKNIGFYLDKKLNENHHIFSSTQFIFKGDITKEQIDIISRRILGNRLIENFTIISKDDNYKDIRFPLPLVKITSKPKITKFTLSDMNEKELISLSKERCLALDLIEMKTIQRKFPIITDAELEIIAQTWSEHCKHKEFNAYIEYENKEGSIEIIDSLFKTYIKASTQKIKENLKKIQKNYLIKIFNDNAGIVKYNDNTNLVFKVETHNSPSALDPYGGAMTGIVGVNRDPAGTGKTGAKPLFNTDIFCFADPFMDDTLPPNTLHPMKILKGVHHGVRDGGNCSGIPTLNGSLIFDKRYIGKPLVFCGTAGLMPATVNNENNSEKDISPGDIALMVGGRVGKDGIHGATMSSESRHKNTPVTAVQIGDPITQKIMLDFIWEIKEKGWIKAITDNGAGGLSSSIGELAQISGGAEIDTSLVPLKYHGLEPWEIFISESQERMTLVVSKENLEKITDYAKLRDVELSPIGTFTKSGYLTVKHGNELAANIPMEFLHEKTPKKKIQARWSKKIWPEPDFIEPDSLLLELKEMLQRLNICSKEYIIRQYDHEVKGKTVIKPLSGIQDDGPSDSACILTDIGKYEGLIIGHGICPGYSDIDPYHMSCCAFDEMVRNIVATGGKVPDIEENTAPMWTVNDNFCCPDSIYDSEKNPDGKEKFGKIVRANKALYDISTAYMIPLTSGKDSMKNDFRYLQEDKETKISIPLTLLYSGITKIDDIRKCVTIDIKHPGDLIYILGITKDELGASEYFNKKGFTGNNIPKVDFDSALKLYRSLGKAMDCSIIQSCHDCSDGGIGVTLAEKSFSGALGMDIDLNLIPKTDLSRSDYLFFSETQSRFIVSIKKEDKKEFETIMKENTLSEIGKVIKNPILKIKKLDGSTESIDLHDLKKSWQKPLRFDLPEAPL